VEAYVERAPMPAAFDFVFDYFCEWPGTQRRITFTHSATDSLPPE